MPSNFTCHHVDSYYSTPEFVTSTVHMVTAFSIPFHFLGLYIILRKTPRAMSSVKWYFVNLHIWIIIYDNLLGVFTIPYVLLPSMSGFTLGLLRHIGVSDLAMTVMVLLACANTLISILAIFENRFHIVCNYSWKTYWEPCRRYWQITHYTYAVLVFIPFWFLLPDPVKAKQRVIEQIPCFPDYIKNGPIFVLTEDYTYHLVSLVSFMMFGVFECAFFIVCLIWNVIQQVRSKKISKRTFELQIKFFVALMIQMAVPAFMLVIPLTYSWVAIVYSYFDQAYSNCVIIFETLHGLCSTLVMIFIHYPYRQAFFDMVWKKKKRTESSKGVEARGGPMTVSVAPTIN